MKWFKHDVDMHSDIKIINLIESHGVEGYGIWLLCLEIIGREGKSCRLDGKFRWKQVVLSLARWSDQGKLDNILSTMADLDLICKKSLRYGNLYIPNFAKRVDEYTQRKIGRMSGECRENVHVEEKRRDKIRKEENRKEEKREEIEFSYLKNDTFKKTFQSYLDTRKTKATDRAKELILKDLHKHTVEIAMQMLEQSIKNGWIGVFELKGAKHGSISQGNVRQNNREDKYAGIGKAV